MASFASAPNDGAGEPSDALAYEAFIALPDAERRERYERLVSAAIGATEECKKTAGEGPRPMPMRSVNHAKRDRLRSMKVLVLDNSQREPSVAAVWGHTLADKEAIHDVVKGLGFRHVVAGVLNHAAQVDDQFCAKIGPSAGATNFWTFSEFTDGTVVDGAPLFDDAHAPIGLRRTAEFGLKNVIIEVDTAHTGFAWDAAFPVSAWVDGIVSWTRWMRREMGADARVIVNFRDLPKGMLRHADRVVAMTAGLARLARDVRPAALLFEEPFGEYLPCEVGGWSALLRATMDAHGWPSAFQRDGESIDGALLVHVHRQWGLGDAVVLDALAGGCDGIMSAVCEEGAALGHASSAVALANLARLGNRDVATRYNLRGVVEAARRVTRLTTGTPVAVRQVVYGPRAVEAVFGFTAVGGGVVDPTFDRDADGRLDAVFLADILGVAEKPVRLHTLATPAQFATRLRQCFGADARFDDALGARLKDGALAMLAAGEKAEYTSAIGLAVLYQRVTGTLAPAMVACVEEAAATQEQNDAKHRVLLAQAEENFQTALRAEGAGDADGLPFESFIANFVHAYLGGNHNTFGTSGIDGAVLDAVRKHFDLDGDSVITFEEWRVWLIWALRSTHDDIHSTDTLYSAVIRHAVMPELLNGNVTARARDEERATYCTAPSS